MAFSFELKLAISSELYGAISAGPEHFSVCVCPEKSADVGRSVVFWVVRFCVGVWVVSIVLRKLVCSLWHE